MTIHTYGLGELMGDEPEAASAARSFTCEYRNCRAARWAGKGNHSRQRYCDAECCTRENVIRKREARKARRQAV